MLDKYISDELMLNKSHFIFQDQICLWDYMDMQWWHHPQAKELLSWEDALLEECLNWRNQWSGQTMQIEHTWPLAIPIPDELVSKQDWNGIFISLTTWIQQFLSTLIYKIFHLFEIHTWKIYFCFIFLINNLVCTIWEIVEIV